MSIVATLSGGIAMVFFLHFLLGRMGAANYWRGVISGAVPTFLLIGYSLFHAYELDVLSIHVALYLSTATVTTLIVGARKGENAPLHLSIKIMVIFFLLVFIVNGMFVSVSVNGFPPSVAAIFLPNASKKPVYTGFTGVTRHDIDAASAENSQLKAEAEMRKLGWRIEIDGVNHLSTNANADNTIRVVILDPQQVPVDGARISIQLMRADDQQTTPAVLLTQTADGEYKGQLKIQSGGNWLLRTQIAVEDKDVQIDHDVKVSTQ